MTGPSDGGVQVEALKPCPFCGGAGRHLEAKSGFYTERVICDECDFYLPPPAWKRRAALPVAPSDERIDAGWGKLSEPKIRTLMQIAHKWAGPDEDDCRSDILEMALREVRVPTQTRPALPVAALSDADRELMQEALKALVAMQMEASARHCGLKICDDAIAALRTRLLRHSEGKE